MTKIDAISHIELSHCLQRAEALTQVLGEAIISTTNDHHHLMIEMIEEYLLRMREVLEIANDGQPEKNKKCPHCGSFVVVIPHDEPNCEVCGCDTDIPSSHDE